MNPDEATADALLAFAQQVLDACAPLEHMPTAHLSLKAQQPGAWFVVYFFGSDEALLQAIKGGDAYVIQQTLQGNIARVPSVQTASVHFEGAYEPRGEPWARAIHDACAERDRRWSAEAGASLGGPCVQCGHDSDRHQMRGWKQSPSEPPRDGWMVCSDETCACFATWSIGRGPSEDA
jgi:hypothetical protein